MKVVFCQCAYSDVIDSDVRARALSAVQAAGLELEAVPDLCALARERDPRLAAWAGDPDTRIMACYPRTVRWLFAWAGACLGDADDRVVNMRAGTIDAILGDLEGLKPSDREPTGKPEPDGDWVPWFPVIDRERCRNCRQCLNFCPFGVYELADDKQVEVRHPQKCKTNCPACARMCPDLAIIFPKYAQDPINGAHVTPAHMQKQKQAASLKDRLKKQDIHSLLAQRGRKNPLGCPLNEQGAS